MFAVRKHSMLKQLLQAPIQEIFQRYWKKRRVSRDPQYKIAYEEMFLWKPAVNWEMFVWFSFLLTFYYSFYLFLTASHVDFYRITNILGQFLDA